MVVYILATCAIYKISAERLVAGTLVQVFTGGVFMDGPVQVEEVL